MIEESDHEKNHSDQEEEQKELDNNNNNNDDDESIHLPKKTVDKGSNVFHILPAKFNNNFSTLEPVNSYFETHIEKKGEYYHTHLRGRLLNGKKYEIPDNSNITFGYVEMIKAHNTKNEYMITQTKDIKQYYLWKYDEDILLEEPMSNLNKLIGKFDVLS